MSLTTEQELQLAAIVGVNRWELLLTYDTKKRQISTNFPEGCSVVEVSERIGVVVRTFAMTYDLMYGSRSYRANRSFIFPYGEFGDMKVFSVIATEENLKALEWFLRDREDFRSAKKLRAMFPEHFPTQKSKVRRLHDYLFGATQ